MSVDHRVNGVELGSPEFWQRLADHPTRLAAEVCLVNVVDLERTLEMHASLHAWVGAAFEGSRIEVAVAEHALTVARARAMLAAKASNDPAGGKKIVDVLKAEVEVNQEVLDAQSTLFALQGKLGALKAMDRALGERKDMLVQISANQRKEWSDND